MNCSCSKNKNALSKNSADINLKCMCNKSDDYRFSDKKEKSTKKNKPQRIKPLHRDWQDF